MNGGIEMNQLVIGKYISLKRKQKNMTQEQLGEKLGVSNKTISNKATFNLGELKKSKKFQNLFCLLILFWFKSNMFNSEVKCQFSIPILNSLKLLLNELVSCRSKSFINYSTTRQP